MEDQGVQVEGEGGFPQSFADGEGTDEFGVRVRATPGGNADDVEVEAIVDLDGAAGDAEVLRSDGQGEGDGLARQFASVEFEEPGVGFRRAEFEVVAAQEGAGGQIHRLVGPAIGPHDAAARIEDEDVLLHSTC
jgi:hypothetical protein